MRKSKLSTDTLQVVILVLVVSVSVAAAGYAVSTSWTTTNTIRVTSSSLGVYADAALTQEVPSSIDWGTYHPGDRIAFYVWIRNQGSNALSLSWTSDLSANSVTGYVSDQWLWNDSQTWRDIAGYQLGPGGVVATKYVLTLSTLTPAGTYTWNLSLSGS